MRAVGRSPSRENSARGISMVVSRATRAAVPRRPGGRRAGPVPARPRRSPRWPPPDRRRPARTRSRATTAEFEPVRGPTIRGSQAPCPFLTRSVRGSCTRASDHHARVEELEVGVRAGFTVGEHSGGDRPVLHGQQPVRKRGSGAGSVAAPSGSCVPPMGPAGVLAIAGSSVSAPRPRASSTGLAGVSTVARTSRTNDESITTIGWPEGGYRATRGLRSRPDRAEPPPR